MKDVTCLKSEVLRALQENRNKHRAIFDEAVEGYKTEALRVLEAHIAEVKAGKRNGLSVMLAAPVDRTRDYDRAIRMLELEIGETVTLSESDVRCYVMDDWDWKRQFLAANSHYSSTAATDFYAAE